MIFQRKVIHSVQINDIKRTEKAEKPNDWMNMHKHTHTQSVLQFHDCQPRERDWDKKNEKEKIMHDHCNSTKL